MLRRPPASPLFPSTTLFRSLRWLRAGHVLRACVRDGREQEPRPALQHDQLHRLLRRAAAAPADAAVADRKSTRLNSSHANISYAVFCLKKKTINALK